MESNQDQALMRGPPDHRANGPDIPLSGYVVSFSALLTCLSPRNSVRTCALARVEGSVPPTSGFGIRRSPLSYTRILFERVRICTSQRGSIGRVYLTTRPPGLPPSVSPYQSASTLFRHRSMVSDRPSSFHQPHGTSGLTSRCCAHSSMHLASRASMPSCRNGATARLMRRGEAYVRFPFNCHTCVIWICHMVLYPIRYRQFSAG